MKEFAKYNCIYKNILFEMQYATKVLKNDYWPFNQFIIAKIPIKEWKTTFKQRKTQKFNHGHKIKNRAFLICIVCRHLKTDIGLSNKIVLVLSKFLNVKQYIAN